MTRRMKRRDSFIRVTKAKAEDYARDMKQKNEESDFEYLIFLYNKKKNRYKAVDRLDKYLSNPDIELVGELSWEEVKNKTGRDSIQVGGDYIRTWIDKKVSERKTEKLMKEMDVSIKVNGENVDKPFRVRSV